MVRSTGKCYGRVKTNTRTSSFSPTVFDLAGKFKSLGVDNKKPPDAAKRTPEELFSSFAEYLSPTPKKVALRKKILTLPSKIILNRSKSYALKQCLNQSTISASSNVSSKKINLKKKIIPKKAVLKVRSKEKFRKSIKRTTVTKAKFSPRKFRIIKRSKKSVKKPKKELKYLNESIHCSPSLIERNWESITEREHSFIVEKQLSYKKYFRTASCKKLSYSESDLTNLSNELFFTRTDMSRNPCSLEITDIGETRDISKNVASPEKSKFDVFIASTPISIQGKSKKAPKATKFEDATSTPSLLLHEPFAPLFNVSEISKVSETCDQTRPIFGSKSSDHQAPSLEANFTTDLSSLVTLKKKSCSIVGVNCFETPYNSEENKLECDVVQLLEFCQQDSVIKFEDACDWSQATARKIGEGTYGEVFKITIRRCSSVMKVIAFSENSTDESMQSIESVFSEMKAARCLSKLRCSPNFQTPNFNKLISVKVVSGFYPIKLLEAWDKFPKTFNCRPDCFTLKNQQMFAILELEYAGQDMNVFSMRNFLEASCILTQIIISLAIAEEAHLFEHRDLHLGNILVKRNSSVSVSYIFRGKPFSIPSHGLLVTIIDFGFSRVLDEDGVVFYNDLANDESLFNHTGNDEYEVYKQSRKLLQNNWKQSDLYSNVQWLIFLWKKLFVYPYARGNTQMHDEGLAILLSIHTVLTCSKSALEVLPSLDVVEAPKKIPPNIINSSPEKFFVRYPLRSNFGMVWNSLLNLS